ncbi:hypothetical protein Zmor_008604 [Zophobas morio]|uniref:Ribosomal RNA-processing protein 8 n=1 Tax=Zophobas morio TaxID=2755281 RepID=A0AA38MQK9_9CUCU|nr:hypothetical protein Zmor_008604 [Zophobas morio]
MFQVAKFDRNNEADSVCKELFKAKIQSSKKETKIKKGKISKKSPKKKNAFKKNDKIKDEIKNILNNNSGLVHQTKIKRKKKKPQVHQDKRVEPKMNTPIFATQNKQESNTHTGRVKKQKRKKKKRQQKEETTTDETNKKPLTPKQRKNKELNEKLLKTLQTPPETKKHQKSRDLSLRERMMQRLQAARFRYINEQIYSNDSKEAQKLFKDDPDAFTAYHEGYRQQVNKWPLNPLDEIIKNIQQLPKTFVVADFGCGDAKLAQSVVQKVHSFDLVAANNDVIPCDMAHVPLQPSSIDVAVFCLSLMGTNLHEYLLEANRVLKPGGILKIAEVESRFDDVQQFIEAVERFRFKNTFKDLSHDLFYFLDFKKESNIKNKKRLPTLSLNPCLYKKR